MITVLLAILKIIGIILGCVLGLLLAVLLLALFVPVRYRITACRHKEDEAPVRVSVKVTWLLHIVNAAFRFPEEAGLKVRFLCFTVFPTGKTTKKEKAGEKAADKEKKTEDGPEEKEDLVPVKEISAAVPENEDTAAGDGEEEQAGQEEETGKLHMLFVFFGKLIEILRNIQYTIQKICDKIKKIVKNIRYYLKILQSDPFKRAFGVCSGEALSLLRSIFPYKVRGSFRIGTGDPASTAQIIGIQGILYPFIGDHITVIPDFECAVAEGDLFVKGKITLFRALKTAVRIYFNKDLRKVIRLLKKEAA